MKNLLSILFTKSWLRAYSGLSINLSAAWFGLAIVTPNFSDITTMEGFLTLTRDIMFGIIFLVTCVRIEEFLEK